MKTQNVLDGLTLTFQGYRWIHFAHWESEHQEFFAEHMDLGTSNLMRSYNPISRNRKGGAIARQIWILDVIKGDRFGWVALETQTGRFTRGYLRFKQVESCDTFNHQLYFLMSALFIQAKIDVLSILTPGDFPSDIGEYRQIWSPKVEPLFWREGAETLETSTILEVNQKSWWNSKEGYETQKNLVYLKKKIQRQEAEEARQRSPKRRQSILGRLFRPRIND